MRLMIIDDDAETARLLQRRFLLDIPGIKSTSICPGFEAAKMVLTMCYEDDAIIFPDLVVLEAKFNGGASTELIRLIRGCNGMARIPILIYTDSDNEELKRSCLAAGALKIIAKGPHGPEELAAFVATLAPKAKEESSGVSESSKNITTSSREGFYASEDEANNAIEFIYKYHPERRGMALVMNYFFTSNSRYKLEEFINNVSTHNFSQLDPYFIDENEESPGTTYGWVPSKIAIFTAKNLLSEITKYENLCRNSEITFGGIVPDARQED